MTQTANVVKNGDGVSIKFKDGEILVFAVFLNAESAERMAADLLAAVHPSASRIVLVGRGE